MQNLAALYFFVSSYLLNQAKFTEIMRLSLVISSRVNLMIIPTIIAPHPQPLPLPRGGEVKRSFGGVGFFGFN